MAGNEADIKHITVEIRSPDRQLLLVGYLPATTMLSESSDGVIEVEEHRAVGTNRHRIWGSLGKDSGLGQERGRLEDR